MEIKLASGKWTKIFSCYKDAFLSGVYMQGRQTLEFELYHPLVNNSPCVVSSTFLFNCIQSNANNGTTMLQKVKDDTNYKACYNVVTDSKNRKIVEVYIKNDDITTCYFNIKKCPNLNLFKFYNNIVPVSTVNSPILASNYIDVESTTFTHTDDNGNTYDVVIRKSGGVVWYKITMTYVAGAFAVTIPNTNIPLKFRPTENTYNQRIHKLEDSVLKSTSSTFNVDGTITLSSNYTATTSITGQFVTTN